MSYQATDSKKEDFRKYLESNGVIEALTKSLVTLYEEPEKPQEPLDFLKQHIAGAAAGGDAAQLAEENARLAKANEELRARVAELEKRLEGAEQETDKPAE
jgi:cell division septum initiation protein DivIVA|eukprot:TRINITY_DN7870_c0_g5_i1.p1 TRINITY_DN7870_c0_g5~~TRINITY_DN7870_c0_g5_i1.p1  ORF type:complete len:101 (+),score=50.51 TRINITY_DN7870_c0_g5_i1:69-371(+)